MSANTKDHVSVQSLQAIVERDKSALARELHDKMSAYLIASAMDVTHLRHKFAAHDAESGQKFDRLSRMLGDAINMVRRVTEELHPTLLDNVGLFAALRWQIKHMCHRSNVDCASHLPDVEPILSDAAAITLFRIGQEALLIAESHPGVHKVEFRLKDDDDRLVMLVICDGYAGAPPISQRGGGPLGFLRHRIKAMSGKVSLSYPADGGMRLSAEVLLADARAFS